MNKKFLIALTGAAFAISSQAVADDVYVDLSVLNDLGPVSAGPEINPEPLFPIVKKAPAVKKKQSKATRKTKKSKIRKSAVAKEADVVKAATPAPNAVKPEQKTTSESADADKRNEVSAVSQVPAARAENSAAAVARTEGTSATDTRIEAKTAPAPREFVAEVGQPAENKPVKASENSIKGNVSQSPVKAETAAVPADQKESRSAPASEAHKAVPAPQTTPQLPRQTISAEEDSVSGRIVFPEDSSELSEETKAKIVKIIDGFEDPKNNKIAILAYNFDNGEDSFKKKRFSLYRAVEIRSFLLNRGYKNFSIKVINIADDASKRNIVEIDELK